MAPPPAPRAGRVAGIAGAKAATFVTDHGGRRRMIVWHGKPRGGAGWRRGLQIECMLQFVKAREAILSTSCRRMAYRPVGGALIQRDRASNICGESAGGVSPPAALRTVRETLASHGSHQVNKPLCQRLACCAPELLPFPVGLRTRPPDPPPSLQPHYRAVVTTTKRSAPVLGIDTLASRL